MLFIGLIALLVAINYVFEEVWCRERWAEARSINRLVRRGRKGLSNEYTGMTNCRSSRRHYGGYYCAEKKNHRTAMR